MHIGDILMSSSILPVLKKQYPDAQITYLTYGKLCNAALMLDGVDDVYAYDYKSGGGFLQGLKVAKELKKRHYDIGISLDPRERITLIKWKAGIPMRLSLERALGWQLKWEKWFYTNDLPLDGWDTTQHRMAESFQEILRRYFHDTEKIFIPGRFKDSAPQDIAAIEKKMNDILSTRKISVKKYISFCYQTTGEYKDWPAEKFSGLADRLIEQNGAAIILTGINSHKIKGKQILNNIKNKKYVIDMTGETTFPELVALFRKCDLLVTLDTGSAHIAAAAGCPVVTIFTFNSPEVYVASVTPSGAVSLHTACSGKAVCLHPEQCKETRCLDGITVDKVYDTINKLNV